MKPETTHFGYQTIPTGQKTGKVKSVFYSVAPRYDLMNDLMSFGLHRFWKKIVVARCMVQPQDWILDLAGGTGDLSREFAKRIGKNGKVILADINDRMLDKGRERLINTGITQNVTLMQLNAEILPFPENTFDKITIAFGLRNVTDKEKTLKEMLRVLKPGGRAIILEFSEVRSKILKNLYHVYSFLILPKLGKWIVHDEDSYRYLVESIRMHPNQEQLKIMMSEAGFKRCEYQNLHDGIVAIHMGYKF